MTGTGFCEFFGRRTPCPVTPLEGKHVLLFPRTDQRASESRVWKSQQALELNWSTSIISMRATEVPKRPTSEDEATHGDCGMSCCEGSVLQRASFTSTVPSQRPRRPTGKPGPRHQPPRDSSCTWEPGGQRTKPRESTPSALRGKPPKPRHFDAPASDRRHRTCN